MRKKNRPNSVMRGYKPEVVRFCWIAETTDYSFHSGFTWGGIPNLINRVGKVIQTLKLVDILNNEVYLVEDLGLFMYEWAENYAKPDWDIEFCPGLVKI